MSGGALDYFNCNDITDKLKKIVAFGKGAYSDKVLKLMKTTIKKLEEAEAYTHRLEWFLSGDDGEDSLFERLEKDLEELQQKGELPCNERTCQSCMYFNDNACKWDNENIECSPEDCWSYETSDEALEKLELFKY